MAKPKLCLIPAAQGSRFYSVLPSDGVGDFNFARASAATRINKYGLIETVAISQSRLNYPLIDGVVKGCPHHLLEPQRTNLVTYSEAFDNAYWTKSGSSVIPNTVISPDGTTNAFKLVEDSATSDHYVGTQAWTTASLNGQDYTISCFAKRGENNFIQLLFSGATHDLSNYANFDLLNGVVGSSSNGVAKIEAMENGWYKCSFTSPTINTVATSQSFIWKIESATSIKAESYQGDGTSGVYIWGAQAEQGSYATSYIPTQGSASTRDGDVCNGAGNEQVINSTEGVLYFEGSSFIDSNFKSFSLSNGSVSDGDDNRVMIGFQDSILYANVRVGNVYQFNETLTISIDNNNKIALKYKSNDFALWVNGNEVKTGNNGTTFSQGVLNTLQFADGRPTTSVFNGNTKQIQYYNTTLTDVELEYMTSYRSLNEMVTELNLNEL